MKIIEEGSLMETDTVNIGASKNVGVVEETIDGKPVYGMTNGCDQALKTLKENGAKFGDSDQDEGSFK